MNMNSLISKSVESFSISLILRRSYIYLFAWNNDYSKGLQGDLQIIVLR